jgi:hypothetical protein
MDYLNFKNEYLNLCARFDRDTKRKIKNDLNSDVIELQYQINAIEPQVKAKGYGYLYGEPHSGVTLRKIKLDLEYTKQLLTEINQ